MTSWLLLGCLAAGPRPEPPPLPDKPAQLESPDDQGATLVPLDGGPAVMVYRWQLPAEAKEGDVIVNGKVDARKTAEHHRQIARQLAEIARRERQKAASGR